jgi:hypothetical protein
VDFVVGLLGAGEFAGCGFYAERGIMRRRPVMALLCAITGRQRSA